MKPKYQSLENFLKEELRKELQDQQFALAEQKIKALHNRRRNNASLWPHLFDANPDSCNHLKGGRFRALHSYKDYAVRFHTFPDGNSNIKCTVCGKEWTEASPDWTSARDMLSQTSNTPSSSEVLYTSRKEEKKWTISSITMAARTVSQRLTSRKKHTRKQR